MAKKQSESALSQTMNPVTNYFRETRAELKKVTWPTREEWLRLSGIVLVVTVAMAILLGLADAIGSQIVQFLLSI